MDDAVVGSQDLHLDVTNIGQGLLQEHSGITESATSLVAGRIERRGEPSRLIKTAKATATASTGRLDEYGKSDLRRPAFAVGMRLNGRRLPEHRKTCSLSRLPRSHLVTGERQNVGRWSNEAEAAGRT